MGKTGLKTFVCSFTFSLFAFVWAGKEFFVLSQPPQNDIVIPNKNISLFFKGMSADAPALKTIPVKKIALSVPLTLSKDEVPQSESPSIEKTEASQDNKTEKHKDLIPLTFAENDIEFDLNEDALKSNQSSSKDKDVTVQKQAEPQKIAQNFQKFIEQKPDIETKELPKDEETSLNEEEEDFFVNKPLLANVQILRPNAKNVQKIRKDLPLSAEAEEKPADASIPMDTQVPKNEAEQLSGEQQEGHHLIAMVPDEEPQDKQEANIAPKRPILPAFKVAKAKTNTETSPKVAPQNNGKDSVAQAPKNLLIPLETNEDATRMAKAKIINAPEENKLAMKSAKAPIKSMEQEISRKTKATEEDNTSEWQTMAEKQNSSTNAWVAAKGSGYAPNNKIKDEQFYKSADRKALKKVLRDDTLQPGASKDIKLASETVDNLLIPIPEDILNDPNLTPQLVSSSQNKDLEEKVTEQENIAYGTTNKTSKATPTKKEEKATKEQDSGLLKSITSIFKKDTASTEQSNKENDEGSFLDRFKRKNKGSEFSGKILPTEIRLAFQPNRAEISGVTLKWLQAFANKINEDKNAGLEIRIDGSSSYELQQKRLNLLNNILASNGVDFNKVNTIFTTREPNSFIIRTVRINNTNGGIEENNDWQDYYKVW